MGTEVWLLLTKMKALLHDIYRIYEEGLFDASLDPCASRCRYAGIARTAHPGCFQVFHLILHYASGRGGVSHSMTCKLIGCYTSSTNVSQRLPYAVKSSGNRNLPRYCLITEQKQDPLAFTRVLAFQG